jgi:hypothetical protein
MYNDFIYEIKRCTSRGILKDVCELFSLKSCNFFNNFLAMKIWRDQCVRQNARTFFVVTLDFVLLEQYADNGQIKIYFGFYLHTYML